MYIEETRVEKNLHSQARTTIPVRQVTTNVVALPTDVSLQ